jgi:hypothetical protein
MDASVKLTPLDPPDSTNWKVSHGLSSGSDPGHYPHVKLSKDCGAQVITFDIQGKNSITFNQNDPLWVQAGTKPNPKQKLPVGADMGQIGAWKIMNGGKQLVVLDWNDAQATLYYQLNVDGGHGNLEPIIDNGGGMKPPLTTATWEYTGFAVVALAAFAIGMLAHWAWARSRRTGPTRDAKSGFNG